MALLILGATSEIARKNVELFAAHGEHLILAARNIAALKEFAPENVPCIYYSAFDSLKNHLQAEMFWLQCLDAANSSWNEPITGIYIAQGFLSSGDSQKWCEEIEKTIFLNFTSLAIFLETVAVWYEARPNVAKGGWIAVISSVAGDRGRYSNYPYGAAKAGLTACLSGLRARLFHIGMNVLTIKPGLVKTRMIVNRPQEKSLTAADPKRIARAIDCAIRFRRNTLYTPWWWRVVMCGVRLIPEWIFKRLRV